MTNNAKRIHLKQQRLWLLPEKGIYWGKKNTLLIADPHFGKAGHFRKHGTPVPGQVNATNFQLLSRLIDSLEVSSS